VKPHRWHVRQHRGTRCWEVRSPCNRVVFTTTSQPSAFSIAKAMADLDDVLLLIHSFAHPKARRQPADRQTDPYHGIELDTFFGNRPKATR
jgi:hypothetical protein